MKNTIVALLATVLAAASVSANACGDRAKEKKPTSTRRRPSI